jgi:hypothetical protein
MIPHGRPSLVDERLAPEDGKNDKRTLPIDGKVKLRSSNKTPETAEKQAENRVLLEFLRNPNKIYFSGHSL